MDDVTDATFDDEVLGSDLPVVVDFWAPWCGPCRSVEAVLEELAAGQEGRVRFVKMNVDENFVTASRYRVLALPTAMLFASGEPEGTVVGARPRSHYERTWATWLETPSP